MLLLLSMLAPKKIKILRPGSGVLSILTVWCVGCGINLKVQDPFIGSRAMGEKVLYCLAGLGGEERP